MDCKYIGPKKKVRVVSYILKYAKRTPHNSKGMSRQSLCGRENESTVFPLHVRVHSLPALWDDGEHRSSSMFLSAT